MVSLKGVKMVRIISRLDVKGQFLVKPIQFEGLRKLGKTKDFALSYYKQGADEIFYNDITASLFNNPIDFSTINDVSNGILVPFSVGGGVRNVEDFIRLLQQGVDKVVINTHALANPSLITQASSICGSQSVVVHIEAKKVGSNYECYSDCGRIPSGKDVFKWAIEAEKLGAGEIIISSIDQDGMRSGFDINLIKTLTNITSIPIIASSGAGSLLDILNLIKIAKPDGVAIASLIHYKISTINEIKKYLYNNGVDINYEE